MDGYLLEWEGICDAQVLRERGSNCRAQGHGEAQRCACTADKTETSRSGGANRRWVKRRIETNGHCAAARTQKLRAVHGDCNN